MLDFVLFVVLSPQNYVDMSRPWECSQTDWQTDTQTGPILLARPLLREVIKQLTLFISVSVSPWAPRDVIARAVEIE